MISTIALTMDMKLLVNTGLEQLDRPDICWYWVDFEGPDEKEVLLLSKYFRFHALSIEDCLHQLERPKVDFHEAYNFFVLHALNQDTLAPEELDLFVGKNYIVSYHKTPLEEINQVHEKVMNSEDAEILGHTYIVYQIFDKIVDRYFPAVYRIEDYLDRIDIRSGGGAVHSLMDEVFNIRDDLLKLRRTINSMKELLYRILYSEHLKGFGELKLYFTDVYDHLLKLSDIIESNREMTADMRDSYLSINSHRMNTIMTILTVITTIFIPLTFIAGIYGMNFQYMPELGIRYGYFAVLGIMAFMGFGMFLWFKHKGWFDIYK